MVVAMRYASGSVSIEAILTENKPTCDRERVDGKWRASLWLSLDISPPEVQKSNASRDDEINNDNVQNRMPFTNHWIRNEILHLMVSIRHSVSVANVEGISVKVRLLLFIMY